MMPAAGASRQSWTAVCGRSDDYACSPALRRTQQWSALVAATASVLLLVAVPQQPATAAGLPIPTEPLSTSWLARTRRDENEGIENRHRTATSSLGGHCDYDEACAFSVAHSSCQSNECRCLDGHEPDAHATKCTPARGVAILENAELTTTVSVIVALMVFTALFCLVLRLFSKARFGTSGRDRMGDAASPPPGPAMLSSVDGSLAQPPGTKGPGSRRTSRNSVDYAASRRASCGMLAPPADSQSCSRRASGSSVRSQASHRSAASNRSGSLSRVGSRQAPAAAKGAESSAVASAAVPSEASGTEDEDDRVPPAPPPATIGGQQRKPPHEPVRRASSSTMEAVRPDPEQPITRPLRSPLLHDVHDKDVTGYTTAANLE
ncbi:uncharacterized protein LOC119172953 isoform X2 [Rhipicephalus microplus]|uniref:uncharacterized protein LOC119172953 isoform X2 n=1 Tax=Rhipicephalus microplus TaxID=6941 RepID=UPI003F6C5FE9